MEHCEYCGIPSEKLSYHSMYFEEDTDDDGCYGMLCDDCIKSLDNHEKPKMISKTIVKGFEVMVGVKGNNAWSFQYAKDKEEADRIANNMLLLENTRFPNVEHEVKIVPLDLDACLGCGKLTDANEHYCLRCEDIMMDAYLENKYEREIENE